MRVTIVGLRERAHWLRRELARCEEEISKRMGAPAKQAALPGVPEQPEPSPSPRKPSPRKPSVHEENHGEFQSSRRDRLAGIGVDFEPDEENTAAFVNVALHKIRSECRDDDELFDVFDVYLHDAWAASLKPPFPMRALASDKVWPKMLERVRKSNPERTH